MEEADFDFSSLLPKRGAFKSLSFEFVRQLEPEDILRVGTGSLLAHRPIQSIKAIHHRLAQLLAKGFSLNAVAEITGSSTQRISKLKADPTFQDLVTYYQDQMGETQIEEGQRIQEKLKTAAETALDEIADRLEDDEKRSAMPLSELRKIAELGLDRTIAPPKASVHLMQTPQQITLNIGAPRFAESNRAPEQELKTIEGIRDEPLQSEAKENEYEDEDEVPFKIPEKEK